MARLGVPSVLVCAWLVGAACSSQRAPDAPLASTQDPASQTTTTASETHRVGDHDPMAPKAVRTPSSGTTTASSTSTSDTSADRSSNPAAAVDHASAAPVATGGGPVAPDNTGVNARDRNDGHLTPMDQGGSEGDRTTTQKIRQAVVGDKALSFTAKNVKIITINGKVTLRGPVKSSAERASIEAKAREVAGASQVDNQLEVKQ